MAAAPMLWILFATAAAPLQVARNALQRSLTGDAGPWGATLVRFLFGLPFSLAIFATVAMLTTDAQPHPSLQFLAAVTLGGFTQIGMTALLLMSMNRAGFAVGTVLQQASLPMAALVGWLALGDRLSAHAWAGIACVTVGVAVLSWPKAGQGRASLVGVALGLGSAASFSICLNAYRFAGQTLDPEHPIYSAAASVCVAQIVQSVTLVGALAVFRPQSLRAVARSWKVSLLAGAFGAVASAFWFSALALAPAGPVRAVGVIETPIAAAVGRRLFKERLSLRQMIGAALTAVGVVATALG